MLMPELERLALDDGTPIRTKPWPTYDKGNVLVDEEEVNAASRAIRSKLLFRYDGRPIGDTEVGRFEHGLCDHFGVRYALAVSSGTAALALSLMAVGVGPGDEVLCSAFAFPASPSSIMLAGATPVLVGVDENLHIDLKDLEGKISGRTKAILMVHMRGQVGDVRSVAALARENGIALVEDAVPVLGLTLDGRHAGTFGTVGAFSTQSDKSLNTGEGGFILTNDAGVYERAVILSGAYEGRRDRHCSDFLPRENELTLPLYNFRMDEIRGAMAAAQLSKLPHRLATLKRNYERVVAVLKNCKGIMLRKPHSPDAVLGDNVLFRLAGADACETQWFVDALCAEGIDARGFGLLGRCNVRSFWTWEFMFRGLQRDEIRARLPSSSAVLDTTIDIPLSPTLDDADIDDLIAAIRKVYLVYERKPRSPSRFSTSC